MSTLLLILQLFPSLIEAVKTIESTAPVPKTGPAKLQLVLDTAKAGLAIAGSGLPGQEKLLSTIQTVTNSIVSFNNLVGVFKTTPSPAPSAN